MRERARGVAGLLLTAVVMTAVMAGCGRGPEEASGGPSGQGMEATWEEREMERLPEFRFRDLEGNTVSSEQFRGKVLLVDVWATWCPPCKTEMPWFQELYEEHKDAGFEVVGISIDVRAEDAAQFAEEIGVTYTLLHHPGIMKEWGLLGLPTTFIVDREGRIRHKAIGFEEKEVFEREVRALL